MRWYELIRRPIAIAPLAMSAAASVLAASLLGFAAVPTPVAARRW